MAGPYLNDPGYEVPENTILAVPFDINSDGFYKEALVPLKGEAKRDWFNPHYYYCLPLTIGNQYGFYVQSLRDFDITWDGSTDNPHDVTITFINDDNSEKQIIKNGFGNGVVTIQNMFYLKTPPNINLMTVQPPNMYLPGCAAMTGVVETDNVRRDFTFNFKITIPDITIHIRKGAPLGAFIPIPRGFVDNFKLDLITNHFKREIHENEIADSSALSNERVTVDKLKTHESGRRYFKGPHANGSSYFNQQKGLT